MQVNKAIDYIKNDSTISPYARYLKKLGFIDAAIYYKNFNDTKECRGGRAIRYLYETQPTPKYREGQVTFADYAVDILDQMKSNDTCYVGISGMCVVNRKKFEKMPADTIQEQELKKIIMDDSDNQQQIVTDTRFYHAGMHHIVDFKYVLANGILGYRKLINEMLETHDKPEDIQFYQSLLDVVAGLESYVTRYADDLKKIENPSKSLQKLIKAIEVVPLNPATNFYQAYITIHACMFLTDCVEPGRIDNLLFPYYEKDDTVSYDDAYFYIRKMFEDIEKRMGHSLTMHATVGGSKPDGSADYNELTEIACKAIGGLRVPNVSLRVRPDMPEKLWDIFIDNISKGYAQPAIVNENLYIDGLVNQYDVKMEDAVDYCFGGCSEVLIQGKTFCDANWFGYNILDILEQTMCNHLLECESYDDFYKALLFDMDLTLLDIKRQIDYRQHSFEVHHPYPLRTLFTYPCIQRAKNYGGGGSQYSFDCSNIYGSTNAINSLYSIKQFFRGKLCTNSKEELLDAFANNYVGYEQIHQSLLDVEKYGNYNPEIEEITTKLMTYIIDKLKSYRSYRSNGYYMPAVILYIEWENWGKRVGATPDGRYISEPMADSAGAMQGTDTQGPTSVMMSTLAIPQKDCVGTCVLNIRLDQKNFKTENDRKKVKMLCQSYLLQGGCQLQVNVVDREVLLDALENPEKHENVIVRVGGFSDNFVYLSDRIKHEIIKRTEN